MTREYTSYERIGYTAAKYGALKNWPTSSDDPKEMAISELYTYVKSRFSVREVVEDVEAMNNYFQLMDMIENLVPPTDNSSEGGNGQ